MGSPACRFCGKKLRHSFCNLGMSPLSNHYLEFGELKTAEPFYPLHAYVCEGCFLVQLEEFESPANIFEDYAYFSSFSDSWLDHANQYTEQMIERFGFNRDSHVVEIASNDGYLLQYFLQKEIPVLGIEPAANVSEVARQKGIPTKTRFFGRELAIELVNEGLRADLLLGNNVLAHVPDINDFIAGMKIILDSEGVITMEFPHLLRLMEENQFDTIYHEHFSYLSLMTVEMMFAHHGLKLFDVEQLETHGGSLRIYACHSERTNLLRSDRLKTLLKKETQSGLAEIGRYKTFSLRISRLKCKILQFLTDIHCDGKTVAAYGAPAKGNTLLNYCGIGTDFIGFTVDRSPHKQGLFLPGSHIPIYSVEKIFEAKPDYVLILPWNLKSEIISQMGGVRDWNGKFITLIPEPTFLS